MSSHQFRHFLGKGLQAAEFGKQAWRPMSTGEKVSIALALDRADWLADTRPLHRFVDFPTVIVSTLSASPGRGRA